ncbi:uncharacterized protein LOC129292162 [Prosopis cineraria]|uniref:uncharacterized protein LOC129292162 n=1 Tax=Prosopis cineraria TaxID=364024 RepID=UPI00240F159A|nr:uncharacterized protein LOC129292162 [Prosopis cineraria]
MAKKETKRAVGEARFKAFEEFYKNLETKEGEQNIYKIAKSRERKSRDIEQVRCIKDEEGRILVTDDEIKNRWKTYFSKLFNDGEDSSSNLEDLVTGEGEQNLSFYRIIRDKEVKEALKKMVNGRANGPDCISIEAWKCLGEEGVRWLTKLFNVILRFKKMPDE